MDKALNSDLYETSGTSPPTAEPDADDTVYSKIREHVRRAEASDDAAAQAFERARRGFREGALDWIRAGILLLPLKHKRGVKREIGITRKQVDLAYSYHRAWERAGRPGGDDAPEVPSTWRDKDHVLELGKEGRRHARPSKGRPSKGPKEVPPQGGTSGGHTRGVVPGRPVEVVDIPVPGAFTAKLYKGDVLDCLRATPSASVAAIVTSPPYHGVKNVKYQSDLAWGNESPSEHWARIEVFSRECFRVLEDGGCVCINVGDRMKDGSFILLPFLFAQVFRGAAPWRLICTTTWVKANSQCLDVARPDNVTELILIFAKDDHQYHYDATALCQPPTDDTVRSRMKGGMSEADAKAQPLRANNAFTTAAGWRNRSGGHPAVWHPMVPERLIRLHCRPGGLVLDPFCGSGSTGWAALQLGHPFVGMDLSYHDIAVNNLVEASSRPLVDPKEPWPALREAETKARIAARKRNRPPGE